jgi:hypothetical protein
MSDQSGDNDEPAAAAERAGLVAHAFSLCSLFSDQHAVVVMLQPIQAFDSGVLIQWANSEAHGFFPMFNGHQPTKGIKLFSGVVVGKNPYDANSGSESWIDAYRKFLVSQILSTAHQQREYARDLELTRSWCVLILRFACDGSRRVHRSFHRSSARCRPVISRRTRRWRTTPKVDGC